MISAKKIIIVIAIGLLFVGLIPVASLTPNTKESQATVLATNSSTLYIYADFTFTENIYQDIVVMASDIVIDGNGYTLQGPAGTSWGLSVGQQSNVIIKNINITGWSYAIRIISCSGISIVNNIIIGNEYGIFIFDSSNNLISENDIIGNIYGIMNRYYSSNNNITENNVLNNNNGIIVGYTGVQNTGIIGNVITGNYIGLNILQCSNNIISENYIANNFQGVLFTQTSGNIVYHNNIIDNTNQALDYTPTANFWHHPALLEGNYWSDYLGVDDGSGTGKHAIAGDSIGDTNIPWPSTDYDNYPFISENGWAILTPCQLLEKLKQMVIDTPDSAWSGSATNRENAMTSKIDETIELCQNGAYCECYDKVLHDIKPKLTGLKMDEAGNIFGNGIFINPWVIDSTLQQEFTETINSILSALKSQ